jgi:hypothetical protein
MREERRLRVFENRVLRRIFGPMKDEVRRSWRTRYNGKINDQYYSPNIVRVIKSRRMRWAGHVARLGAERVVHRGLVGKPEQKRPLGDPGVDGRIIFGWIFRRWVVGYGLDWAGSG